MANFDKRLLAVYLLPFILLAVVVLTECIAESPRFSIQGKRVWGKDNENIGEGYVKDVRTVRTGDKRKSAQGIV